MMNTRVCFFLWLGVSGSIFTTTTSASELPPGMVVRQGSAALTLEDIDAFAERMPPEQRPGYFDSAKRLDSTLRGMLVERQVANEARELGLDKDPDVQRQVKLAIDSTLMNARVNALRESVALPDFDELARERYQANKKDYVLKGVFDVKHLLVSTDKHSDAEAKAMAEDLRAKAVANPDDFSRLVDQNSEDPSHSQNRGLMRDAGSKTTYVAEFADAANALVKPGDFSPVVKTQFGYHILMLVNRTTDRQRSYEEVKDQIVTELRDTYIKKQVSDYMANMHGKDVESNAELVSSLRTRYAPSTDKPVSAGAPARGQ